MNMGVFLNAGLRTTYSKLGLELGLGLGLGLTMSTQKIVELLSLFYHSIENSIPLQTG